MALRKLVYNFKKHGSMQRAKFEENGWESSVSEKSGRVGALTLAEGPTALTNGRNKTLRPLSKLYHGLPEFHINILHLASLPSQTKKVGLPPLGLYPFKC